MTVADRVRYMSDAELVGFMRRMYVAGFLHAMKHPEADRKWLEGQIDTIENGCLKFLQEDANARDWSWMKEARKKHAGHNDM